jgi:hypothetical protein
MNDKDNEYIHLTHFEGKLFRYQPYSGDYVQYVNDLILNNKIYYSNPLRFNDPFDCKLYGIRFSEESIERFMRERMRLQMQFVDMAMPPEMRRPSPEHVTALLDATMQENRGKTIEECAKAIQDLHELVENEIGVLCLSSDPLNILMYSHYADSHQGICLEFTLEKDNIFNPEQVRYAKDFPQLAFGLSQEVHHALAVALIATKSIDWSYEKEYRSLRGGGAGIIEIPVNYLSGIIFGCAASDETVQAVMAVVKHSGKNIKLSKAVKSDSSFSLSIENL